MQSYDFTGIPEHLHEGLDQWLRHGIEPGGFLRAVLSNDLFKAVMRADLKSLEALPQIVRWLFNNAPAGSWGDPKVATNWPQYLEALERQAEEFDKVREDLFAYGTGAVLVTASGLEHVPLENLKAEQ